MPTAASTSETENISSSSSTTNQTPTAAAIETTGTPVHGCGNGLAQDDEECDDGNDVDDDGCDVDCTRSRVVKVEAGPLHTCLLTRLGRLKCWGDNSWGQCGYASTSPVGVGLVPAEIPWIDVGARITDVSASSFNTCVLDADGQIRCWGHGGEGVNGQPGKPTIGDDETPAAGEPVELGKPAVALDVAPGHACALLDDASVRCWGSNEHGALGYPGVADVGDTLLPADVGDVDIGAPVIQLATGGYATCAVTSAGALICWGENTRGLGYGNGDAIGDDETPASVGAIDLGSPVVAVDVGERHICARTEDQSIYCWGSGTGGALGLGNEEDVGDDEPAAAFGAVDVGLPPAEVVVGTEHTCLVSTAGKVRCWGANNFGALGYGNTANIGDDETPASAGPVLLDASIRQMSLGWGITCVLSDGGDVWCWGTGALGYSTADVIGDDETPMSAGPLEIFP